MKKLHLLTATAIITAFVFSFQSCMKEVDVSSQAAQDEANLRKAQPTVMLTAQQQLGKFIYFDPRLSSSGTQSCATCHAEKAGFAGEVQGFKSIAGIYEGAVPGRFGNRKPPTAAYASFSPVMHFSEDDDLIEGGSFWDGRATGWTLGSPVAEQALGPFLNPLEQNCPSREFILDKIANSAYANLWNEVFPPLDWSTPEATKTSYNNVGFAVASFEASPEVNKFTSKFDYYLKGQAKLNPEEYKGMLLFNGKAKCNFCHISVSDYPGVPPLFTDYTYDNLGVPRNPDNPFYYSPYNSMGYNWVDKGLGGFLETLTDPYWNGMAEANMGKHKVPTVRNVGLKMGGARRFMHNGAFTSLKEVVDFYNTRDVKPWPAPEVPETVNTSELGDLGLTTAEVSAIIAFMNALSDGYSAAK